MRAKERDTIRKPGNGSITIIKPPQPRSRTRKTPKEMVTGRPPAPEAQMVVAKGGRPCRAEPENMPRDMKVHMFECAKMLLQPHVMELLEKRGKRFFKGRNIVDAITDMCVEGSKMINNNDEDKSFIEYALWNCMNSTRYMMAHRGS
ncbi:uncharacterized protein LOC144134824 [Amblyomma americanum]